MRRLRAVSVSQLVLIGFVTGLILASAVTLASARRYEESSVYLLGSGNGLSALIVTGTARVLVVNADDPAALATAFAEARPAMLRRVDILVLAPEATELVAERAVEISEPRRIYALPNDRFHPGNRILGHAIRPMDGSSSLRIGSSVSLAIEPAGMSGWTVTVSAGATSVLLAAQPPLRSGADAVVLMGERIDDRVAALTMPVVAAKSALIGDVLTNQGAHVKFVERAGVVRIRFSVDRVRMGA